MTVIYIIGSLILQTIFALGCYRIGYHYGKADGLMERYKSRKEANT